MKRTPIAIAVAVVVGLGGLVAASPPAGARTTNVTASADTYVSSAAPSATHGNARRLRIDGRAGARKIALIKLVVPAAPAGQQVESVQLRLRPTRTSAAGVVVYRTSSSWREGPLTWRTAPSARTRLGASDRLVAGTAETIALDASKITPGSVLALRLETTATKAIGFASSEAASGRPAIRVVTSAVPGGPPPPDPVEPFPPATPMEQKLIGMSAPADLWAKRVRQVGSEGLTARRIFASLGPSGGTQMSLIRQALADGMMPVVSYKVPSVRTMIAGGYDAGLARLRRQLTSLHRNVTATFWHEPNGDMSPADFRAASQRFFDLVDAPTIAIGPILNGFLLDRRVEDFATFTSPELLEEWEFVAVDSYQSGEPEAPGTAMPARAIPLLASWMDSVGQPDKPLGLGEYNGFTADAIAEAGTVLLSTPEVWFGIAWNSTGDSYAPLAGDRITAFQRTKADPRAAR